MKGSPETILNNSTCQTTTFKDGGRTEVRCQDEPHPDYKCVRCGHGWCSDHSEHSELEDVPGIGLLCFDCESEVRRAS